MVNRYSPATDYFPLEPPPAPARATPPLRYPSVPPALRALQLGFGALAAVSEALAFRAAWRLFCTPRRLPVKPWETAALASARPFKIPLGRGHVTAYEWGAAGAPAVLLVHGWEHRAAYWGAFAQALVTAGYRVVALDGPAHGASSGKRTNVPEFGSAVQAVADVMGDVQAVVAHSFGAAALAALPVRFNDGGALPRLVLLSAPGSMRAVAERFVALLHLPAGIVERIARHIKERYGRPSEEFSLTWMGPRLAVNSALLLHDELDEIVPFNEAHQIARAWPALRFEATHGLGHNRILRDPGVIARVLTFIR